MICTERERHKVITVGINPNGVTRCMPRQFGHTGTQYGVHHRDPQDTSSLEEWLGEYRNLAVSDGQIPVAV